MPKIVCPDCGQELKEVTVERSQLKSFKVDQENNVLTPVNPEQGWDDDDMDYSYRCPNCDSLEVNEDLQHFELRTSDIAKS